MKKLLMMSGALLAFSAASNVTALDIDVSAKVEFAALFGQELRDINGDNSNGSGTTPPYQEDATAEVDTWFTDADLKFTASQNTCCLDYGIEVNLDIDPFATSDGNPATDILYDADAKIFVNTQYGRLEFGEVDASQAAFYQSFMDVGPLHGGKEITLPFVSTAGAAQTLDNDHSFDQITPLNDNLANRIDAGGVVLDRDISPSLAYFAPLGPLSLAGSINASDEIVVSLRAEQNILGHEIGGVVAFAGDTFAAQLETEVMGVKIGGTMGEDGDNEEYFGGGIGYEMGALSFSATAIMATAFASEIATPATFKAEEMDLTFGVDYKLSSGLVVDAAVQSSRRETETNPTGAATNAAIGNDNWTRLGLRISASF